MTPNRAKALLKSELDRLGLPYTKLTAKTVNFLDLARADAILVRIVGWQPNPCFDDIKKFGKEHGFIVESSGVYCS